MKRFLFCIFLSAFLLSFSSCSSSPEDRAQKLYNEGKYEEIIAKYPTLMIAGLARNRIADKLLRDGKYEEILSNYSDTPSARIALTKLSEKRRAEGKYDDFVKEFLKGAHCADPPSCAEQLYKQGKYEELMGKYPNTPAGIRARNEKAQTEWTLIGQLTGDNRRLALEAFLKNPLYAGTDNLDRARQELAKMKSAK